MSEGENNRAGECFLDREANIAQEKKRMPEIFCLGPFIPGQQIFHLLIHQVRGGWFEDNTNYVALYRQGTMQVEAALPMHYFFPIDTELRFSPKEAWMKRPRSSVMLPTPREPSRRRHHPGHLRRSTR